MVGNNEIEDFPVKTYMKEFLPDGLPEKIYKFASISENTLKALREGYLWYSSPSSFNDPYDCYRHLLKFEPSKDDILAFVTKTTHLKGRALELEIEYFLANPGFLPEAQFSNLPDTINEQGICCFTLNYKNTLMWSHYAKNHSGICMVFEPRKDIQSFFICKVRYAKEFIPVNYYEQNHIGLMFLIVTKSDDWAYECEYRSINPNHGAVAFRKNALVEIIFGCKVRQEDVYSIVDTLESSGYKGIKYTQAYMESNSFKLGFKQFPLL
ncbi:DUF2971 domain-containing protein [Pedobacter gandavensis]|uniref:DUF2971 domain-containing protein n=1 Tax=Pedobacter gandavensis TaxID=2679963 RepID=UPI0029316B63|nr:DUF2971 domain-containing protein [Pedobacter gandavensis]